jgi:hypothetical protein
MMSNCHKCAQRERDLHLARDWHKLGRLVRESYKHNQACLFVQALLDSDWEKIIIWAKDNEESQA